MIKKIIIDKEEIAQLESLHYKYFTIKDTVAHLMTINKDNAEFMNSEVFKAYEDRLFSVNVEYETLKTAVVSKYLPEEYKVSNRNWSIDFKTCELVIE